MPDTHSKNRTHSSPNQSDLRQLVTPSSEEFAIYGQDVDHLKVQVSVSGVDKIRLTVRDADKDRYEVPVPIRWQSASIPSSAKAKIEFEMPETTDGHVGFRVRRTDTKTLLFDTSYFAHGFVYDDKFIQLITTIPSANVYGKTSV